MKKHLCIFVAALVLFTAGISQAAEKVVVIPVSSASNVTVEPKTQYVSILGNTFTPYVTYGDSFDYSNFTPRLLKVWNGNGVAHNVDGETKTFLSAVNLPQGAKILEIGASICVYASVPDTDHDINVQLWKTDMRDGSRTKVREHNINEPACNTLQDQSGIIVEEIVDNEIFVYSIRVTGMEGGTCTVGFPLPDCDDRRAILQFVRIGYSIDTLKVQ